MSAAESEADRRQLHDHARSIFHHALAASSIPLAFDRRPMDAIDIDVNLYAVAVGKAALPMLDGLASHLPRALAGGICCAPTQPETRVRSVDYFVGGHPLPNSDSFASARAALALLRGLGPRDLVFFLISGGGSAMFELPLDPHISLQDTRVLYQALVGCGATISQINTVRKHFSAVKGGRLAAAAGLAQRRTLLVSDVGPHHLDALASGLTLADSSTVVDCRRILDQFDLRHPLPQALQAFFADPALAETPKLEDSPFETLLSSDDLLQAARREAESLGYQVVIDNDCDDWDYGEAARHLLSRFQQLRREHQRPCLLSGGEVTVRLGQQHGTGGRNQQFALACGLALSGFEFPVSILSAGSDGIDGNSPAAGAVADATTVSRSTHLGIDAGTALERFDAYPLFTALGDTLVTGPTHNNLRDLRILLSA